MAVYKDGDKWRVIYRYTNYKGERKQTQKCGFATKREAQAWEREVMLKSESKLDMTFASFFEIYEADKKKRVKENTWESKSHIIRTKILPYFGERKIAEIEPKDVIAWQNELLAYKGENGEVYSPTYLKTIHSQLSAIFNHAVRYYHLPSNPAQRAGTMGSEEHKEMLFWTKEEYLKFADVMMDKPVSYYAFELLYWTGIRCGELLALTPKDFNFERQELTINKSYQNDDVRECGKTVRLPTDKADYMRMSVAEKVRCYPFDERGTDATFEMVRTYFEKIGMDTSFDSVYEETKLLTDYYEKQKAEEFIGERAERVIETMELLGIDAGRIAGYSADVLSEVFGVGDMEYFAGIKLFNKVIDILGVDMDQQKRYEVFEHIYEAGMREKKVERNRNSR